MAKPRGVFVATHPRACSTAFERVFMTRTDILHCVHEPLGDAYYYGPERLADRYEDDEKAREESGFSNVTYKDVFDKLLDPNAGEGRRLFIKDMAHYMFPPPHKGPATIAPSLRPLDTDNHQNGTTITNGNTNGTNGTSSSAYQNPSVVPTSLLAHFHFTFLIRHPRRAIPSYYRCTIPPLSSKTGFTYFDPSDAGYRELRLLLDHLRARNLVGPDIATASDAALIDNNHVRITVIDADDLLDKPEPVIRAFCNQIGIDFQDRMLKWGESDECQTRAKNLFEKWSGFHDDAIASTELRAREHGPKILTREQEDQEWTAKYGEEGAKLIRKTVDDNVADYDYLKSFAIKF